CVCRASLVVLVCPRPRPVPDPPDEPPPQPTSTPAETTITPQKRCDSEDGFNRASAVLVSAAFKSFMFLGNSGPGYTEERVCPRRRAQGWSGPFWVVPTRSPG